MPRIQLPQSLQATPFTVAQAYALGMTEGRLRGRDLERPFHGIRFAGAFDAPAAGTAAPPSDPSRDALIARCSAYAPLLRPGQFFSHITAARLWNGSLPTRFEAEEPLHVSVLAPARAPRSAGIVGHQFTPTRGAIATRFGLPVLDAATVWLQLASTLGVDDLVALGDHLVLEPVYPEDRRPHCSTVDLLARLAGFSGRGAITANLALPLVRVGSESRRETLLRLLLLRSGLPEPRLNIRIVDAAGRFLGRADMVYPAHRTIVEYDGDHHRTDARQYERDIARIDSFIEDGWRVIRIRKRGLGVGERETVERVRRALLAGGWTG